MDITLSIHHAEDRMTYIIYDKAGDNSENKIFRFERKARLETIVDFFTTHEDICQLSICLIINARGVCFQLSHFKGIDIAYQHRSNC